MCERSNHRHCSSARHNHCSTRRRGHSHIRCLRSTQWIAEWRSRNNLRWVSARLNIVAWWRSQSNKVCSAKFRMHRLDTAHITLNPTWWMANWLPLNLRSKSSDDTWIHRRTINLVLNIILIRIVSRSNESSNRPNLKYIGHPTVWTISWVVSAPMLRIKLSPVRVSSEIRIWRQVGESTKWCLWIH